MSATVSPDGRWLAYSSDESGASEVYVRPFPEVASARWQASLSGGSLPVWARNGRELFYLNGRQEMMGVEVKPGPGFALGEPRLLFPAGQYTLTGTSQVYDVSADGRRFVMVRPVAGVAETELVLVQNWFEELKTRVGK
jgi:Tol biopolymer transport system component